MLGLLLKLVIGGAAFAADPVKVFIQSQSTQLKDKPQAEAQSLGDLKRGDELTLVKREGLWLQVQTKKNVSGWVPKIFTSTTKPMGQSQLLKDTANLDSTAKTSRRRTTDYAVSAATRGLAASEKHRPGDEVFRSNRKAVDDLEKMKITPEKLEAFKKEVNLKGP